MSFRVAGAPRPVAPQNVETHRTSKQERAGQAEAPVPQPQRRVAHGEDHFSAGHVHGRDCATTEPARLPAAVQARVDEAIAARTEGVGARRVAAKAREIDVYFHVVNRGEGIENGDVPREMIDAQVEVLNAAYAKAGFSFVLREVTRTTNPRWNVAGMDSAGEEMKAALHRGDASDLNFYVSNPGEGLLGYATFPDEQVGAPKLDGVVVRSDSLPGGDGAPYNLGQTATHEVGHWLGLYHTFQDPYGDGDGVEDTPAHQENGGTPPLGTDTIPELPGVDPVHNFMNYTDDAWMKEFTPGQEIRMQAMWDVYRNPELERPSVNDGLDPLPSKKVV